MNCSLRIKELGNPPLSSPLPSGKPPVIRRGRQLRAANTLDRTPNHQAQYDDPVANFFNIFNRQTGRDTLFCGFMLGHLANNKNLTAPGTVAVDFGCGTGWLSALMARQFPTVYGIDTSAPMLQRAIRNTAGINNVFFHQSAPPSIKEACDFIAAVHVHYHFDNKEKLRGEFFQAAADLLKPQGELLLIGCPSAHIHDTPEHYFNSVAVADIPPEVLARTSQIDLLADENGYVALNSLPQFPLKDGTQMSVTFKSADDRGRPLSIQLTDTFWSDETLESAAAEAGLDLDNKMAMAWGDHPYSYMAMVFKKRGAQTRNVPA